jgi:hypothetical protein
MKKLIILAGLILFTNLVFGQAYIITYIRGNVYHNRQLLKLHDKQITSDDKTAELALFSAQKGKFRLSFATSKPVAINPTVKKSELYQLVVGNYLLAYTTEKTLTTRGDFDLKTFLNDRDTGFNAGKVYLPEGVLLPVKSQSVNVAPSDKLFICTVNDKDTSCTLIPRKGSFMVFDGAVMHAVKPGPESYPTPVAAFIKHGFMYEDKYAEDRISGQLTVTFISKEYMQTIVDSFKQGLNTYYHDDKAGLVADVEDQLGYYYGKCFEPAVRQVILSDLNK